MIRKNSKKGYCLFYISHVCLYIFFDLETKLLIWRVMSNTYKLNRTGLIYDPLMLDYHCEWDPQYPEKPDRIKKPFERCQFYGLTEKCISLPVNLI
jgi:hypothetical protein